MSLPTLYNRTASNQRASLAASSHSAAASETWANVAMNFRCAIQPLNASERDLYGKTYADISHRLFCEPGIDIRPRDRVYSGGKYYRVTGIQDAAGRGHHQEIFLTERVET